MGTARSPGDSRLFAAVMAHPGESVERAVGWLVKSYGPIGESHGPITFGFTDYYEPEMGTGLVKQYLVFENPFDRSELATVKTVTNAFECSCAHDDHRTVNIDPGYLCRDKLVLASTKDYYHRIYLDQGIFAEVTLHMRGGVYRSFSWTYADYKDTGVQAMLMRARARLVGDIRRESRTRTDS